MELIPKIKERRMEKYLSQTDLSEITGIHKSRLSKFENGKNEPSIKTLWIIARGIGCLVDELYEVSN